MTGPTVSLPTLVLPLLLLAGCANSRPILTEEQLYQRHAADRAHYQEDLADAVRVLVAQIHREHEEYAAGRTAEAPTFDILALSGGGDHGAFGAGFLCGWDEVQDPELKRPQFDGVTGVSTGALIAPFAFLGTRSDLECIERFYRNPRDDWVELRDWLFFLPGRVSLLEIEGLEREIRATIDHQFVQRLANEASHGRVLAVSATNLEFGAQRVWDVGQEAQLAMRTGHLDPIHRILLASSAIPGAFPPVEINSFLYSDGGITANILLPLDPRSRTAFFPTWKREHPEIPVPKMRYWIIVNKQLRQPPKTAQPTWPSTAGVGIDAAVRASNLAQIQLAAAHAELMSATQGARVEVRVVAIPDDWRPPVKGTFKKENMDSLADLGRRLGKDTASWTLYTAPHGP